MKDLNKRYSEEYDAYYDAQTGEWLESKCDDPNCQFCANRPKVFKFDYTDDSEN